MRRRVQQADLTRALQALHDLSDHADEVATRYGLHRPLSEPIPLAHDRPARQLHGAAAILCASVLMDSAVEHYRGSFKNTAMVMPLISSALNIASSLHGMSASNSDSHKGRTLAYIGAIGVGALGTASMSITCRTASVGFAGRISSMEASIIL